MFETGLSKSFAVSKPLKAIAICAAGLLLAAGFCGLDAHLYPHAEFGGSFLATMGAALGVLSMLGMVGSVIALILAAIVNAFRR